MPRQSTTPQVWNERRLRLANQAAGVALWAWNVDTDNIALDERAHLLWGLPVQDGFVTFETLSARIHPQDLDRLRAAFAATREMHGDYELDFRIMHNGDIRWISARGKGEDEGIVGWYMYGVFLDVTARKFAEESRELIADEMNHRVKNLFAIASALARISSRTAKTTGEMAQDIAQRLNALAQAHDLIRPSLSDQKKAVQLRELLATLLVAYDDRRTIGERISIDADGILVGEGAITTVALVIHELATNSIKYGSLTSATGSVHVSGTVDDDCVTIVWTEKGGPPVTVPKGQAGFGTKLVHSSIHQLGGTITSEWPTDGAVVTIRAKTALLGV